MQLITIPQKLARNGDLVVIPRREYEGLLRDKKKKQKGKDDFHVQLDRDLDRAIKEYRRGKVVGPFASVSELKKSLEQ